MTMNYLESFLEEKGGAETRRPLTDKTDETPFVDSVSSPRTSLSAHAQPNQSPQAVEAFKPRRGFIVSTAASARCRNCGNAGEVPHHLSLVFWQFWNRSTLQALLDSMRQDERLNWIAHGEVRLEDGAGNVRYLRERDGRFVEIDLSRS
jgi:hypothetical protein